VIIAKELIRLIQSQGETSHFLALLQPGLFGMLSVFLLSQRT
jgi:hypothetical protein